MLSVSEPVPYSFRRSFRFPPPALPARFDALTPDLGGHRLLDVTRALSARDLTLNGDPYVSQPADMVMWLDREPL